MSKAGSFKDSNRNLFHRIRRVTRPLAAAVLAAMTVGAAWAQTVSIGNGSVLEGNAGTTTLNVPLTRVGDTSQAIGLTYRTNAGGAPQATAGTDYVDTEAATAVLPAGATTVNLPVSIQGDTDIEPDEQFLVHLLSATNAGPTPDFAAALPFPTGFGSRGVTHADINGDGRLDLALANQSDNTVSVLLNTTEPGAATPTFSPQATFATGSFPQAIVALDANNDGRPDLAITNQFNDNVSVLLNTTTPGAATPAFATQRTFVVGNAPVAITTADVNADGRTDLLVGNNPAGNVSVLLNTTTPGFLNFAPQQVVPFGPDPSSVSTPDLNGDGRPDLLVANIIAASVSVGFNTTPPGASTISYTAPQTFATGSFPRATAADVNGDGRPDLLVVNQNSATVSVLLNTAAPGAMIPSFAAQQTFASGNGPIAVQALDLNADGRPDLSIANQGGTVSVLLNTTSPGATVPGFAPRQTFATGVGLSGDLTTADFNGDGLRDLAVTKLGNSAANANVWVLLNTTATGNSALSFAPRTDSGTGNSPHSVTHADFNGDGRLDQAVANFLDDTVSVRFNTAAPGASAASFAARTDFAVGDEPISVSAADFNGDGRSDLAVSNRASDSVSVLLNTTLPGETTPSFAMAAAFLAGDFATSVTAADLNGDGRPDLVTANGSALGNASVLLNTTAPGAASPSFATKTDFGELNNPRSVTVADFNGDGRPDLATANFGTDNVSILLNTTAPGGTTPSFATQSDFRAGDGAQFVAAADLNGDGRPDLAVANILGFSASVLLNTIAPGGATASFATQAQFPARNYPSSVTAADFNGDGRPDLALGHSTTNVLANQISVLRNLTAPGATTASFAAKTDFATGNSPASIAAADVNGDGRPDLVTANNGSTTISVLLNRLYPVTVSGNEATATILNDDVAQLSIDDVTLAEGSGAGMTDFTFTVSLPSAATGTVTVDYATANDSATVADADYAAAGGNLSFAPGELSKTVTVQVNADTKFETNERFFVNLSNAVGTTIGDGQGVGNISNDDTQPSIRFVQPSSSVSEGLGALNLAVELSNPSYQAVSFSVSGTPAPGADYSGLTSGPITIGAGNTTATVSLTVTDDALDEFDELLSLALTSPVNASVGSPSAHALTILDNDETPTVSFASATLSVAENAGMVQSRVILSAASSQDVTATVSVTGGSAANGSDYTLPTDSVVHIPAGQTFADLSIAIGNDALDEDNETLNLQIFTPSNATVALPFTQTVTIVDDDATPTVSFDTAGASYDESAGTVMIPVRLSAASALEVRAAFAVSGSATSPDFSSVTASALVFPPSSTAVNIVLSLTDDTLDENLETVVFTLGALSNANLGAQPVHTVSINDNDDPPPVNYSGFIQQPINPDGSSTFNVKKGVVQVKFTLTLDGVSTCNLPPASIRVSRIGGAMPGPIDESVYDSPADTGPSFRTLDCQYQYKLAVKSLGVGRYTVELMIGGASEGVGTFELK